MALGRKPIEIVNEGKNQLLAKAEHWDRIFLSEVAKVQNGYAFSSANFSKSDGLPLIRIRDIDSETTVDRYKGEFPKEYLVQKGDILVGMDGDFKAAKWKGQQALLNQRVCRIIPNSKLFDEKFLFLCLQPFLNAIHEETSAVTVKHLSSRTIEELPLPFPNLKEQKQIVGKIEELFSDLDKGIEELKTAQHQLKVYRQAVLKWAFEGRLTNEDVKDGELPKGWESKAIVEVASINPKMPDRERISDELEIQFLPMKLVEEIINKCHLTETRKFKEVQKGSYTPFIDGDVIFAKVTPCMENGKIAVLEKLKNGMGYGSSEFHVVRCSSSLLNRFLFYFIVQDRFRNEAANAMTGAVGLRRVPKQFIENYLIPLPTIKEQQQIVQEIESRLSVCDKIEDTITDSLNQAEALRQSILKKAFSGEFN